MRIYYFIGNKTRGFDLTNELEDTSINMQKKKALRQAGFKVDVFKNKSLQESIRVLDQPGAKNGICSEERSMIHPDYARNFICDFILGKEQQNSQLTIF